MADDNAPTARPASATARVAALADALEARARAHAPLLDLLRAHLDAHMPGRSRSGSEHLLDLLEIGLRWRASVPPARRARAAGGGGAELARLAAQLATVGCPAAKLDRLHAWRDFALSENVRGVVTLADEMVDWLEAAARPLGPALAAPDEALELLRAEVLGRVLRRRRPVFGPGPRVVALPIPAGAEEAPPCPGAIGMVRAVGTRR